MPQMKFSTTNRYPSEQQLNELKKAVEEIFSNLKNSIKNKKDLFDIILNEYRVLQTDDTIKNQKPEEFTKRIIIRPLLKILGYTETDIGTESEQELDIFKRWADYTLSVEDEYVLVEAEPLNRDLKEPKSGLYQIKEVILSKSTKTDFGLATNGFLWIMVKFDKNYGKLKELKTINLRPIFSKYVNQNILPGEDEILKEFYSLFAKANIISAFKEVFFKLEEFYEEISHKFYSEYMDFVFGINSKTGSRSRGYCLLTAIKSPEKKDDDIRLFAITSMNRILFIKFLEDKGLVKKNLLKVLWTDFSNVKGKVPNSFYKTYLQPLFFEVFNIPPKNRIPSVKRIQHFDNIPYLNGGLLTSALPRNLIMISKMIF